jgi:(S)-2-hydroxyglutarate dehydrogenase
MSNDSAERSDIAIIGGGLVGLSTAHSLLDRHPGLDVVVIEKEDSVAGHQSGRNSGVIHSGIYYAPGSVKALTCRRGRALLLAFAREHDIPHERCGKVIVAVDEEERGPLHELARRGSANGVDARLIGTAELARLEPAVRGVEALHVNDAGIIDYVAVAEVLRALVVDRGGRVMTGATVESAVETPAAVRLQTTLGDFEASAVVACAGLHSDRVARMFGAGDLPVRIVPFRGEYHALRPAAADLCRNLIYPVPDPRFPFLGVHLTRHINGRVLAGPNAVPALRREGYRWRDASWHEMASLASHAGARALAREHWRTGLGEMWRSLNRRAFVRALQRMTPDITVSDLLPYPAGVRAQAVGFDGSLADDFVFHTTPRTVQVLNAPSPAATAALAIGESLAERTMDRLV